MKELLKQKEIEKLQSMLGTHPLFLTSKKVFFGRMQHLRSLVVEPEDVFREAACLLDFLLCNQERMTQRVVNNYWTQLVNDIRKWKPDAQEEDKRLVAGTVFCIVRDVLGHHWKLRFNEDIYVMLTEVLDARLASCTMQEKEEQRHFLKCLTGCSEMLSTWINGYEDGGEWLSDEIASALDQVAEGHDTEGHDSDFKPTGRTFTKSAKITDVQIDIICQRLTQANKLEASPDDFRKLFSGVDSLFTMKWLGMPGELRDLFKMLTDPHGRDGGYISPKRGYQYIIRSHFKDKNGNWFGDLDGQKSISGFKPVISDCELFIQHLPEKCTEVMRQYIKKCHTALEEDGYFMNTTSAKNERLRIRNRPR